MNKLKALIVTLVMGSSSVAMASPATFIARGSVSFNYGRPSVAYPAPRTVVVRDHRFNQMPDYRVDVRDEHCATFSLTGTYSSEFGRVTLYQHGDRVTGSFAGGGGGTIEGRIIGNQIVYVWKGSTQRGRGVWHLSGSNRLQGTWGNGHSDSDGGAWNLKR